MENMKRKLAEFLTIPSPPKPVGFSFRRVFNREMQAKSDAQLLREYARQGSEAAFREIVARYTDLVYSAVMRQSGSADMAEDVAQSVFNGKRNG